MADVTFITTKRSKQAPNPNVMLELGYASARRGWDRIILVMNEAYGPATELPFDLEHRRRPICYSLAETASRETIKEKAKRLSDDLKVAFQPAKASGLLHVVTNPLDIRVANRLEGSLSLFLIALRSFLQQAGAEDAMCVFYEYYADVPGTSYPSVDLMNPIAEAFAHHSMALMSNMSDDRGQIPWIEVFHAALREIRDGCRLTLSYFGHRDESLVALTDDLEFRADGLMSTLLSLQTPELERFYLNGLEERHFEPVRFFLLAILKTIRTTRQFRGLGI